MNTTSAQFDKKTGVATNPHGLHDGLMSALASLDTQAHVP